MGVLAAAVYDVHMHCPVIVRLNSSSPSPLAQPDAVLQALSTFIDHVESMRGLATTPTEVSAAWTGAPEIMYQVVASGLGGSGLAGNKGYDKKKTSLIMLPSVGTSSATNTTTIDAGVVGGTGVSAAPASSSSSSSLRPFRILVLWEDTGDVSDIDSAYDASVTLQRITTALQAVYGAFVASCTASSHTDNISAPNNFLSAHANSSSSNPNTEQEDTAFNYVADIAAHAVIGDFEEQIIDPDDPTFQKKKNIVASFFGRKKTGPTPAQILEMQRQQGIEKDPAPPPSTADKQTSSLKKALTKFSLLKGKSRRTLDDDDLVGDATAKYNHDLENDKDDADDLAPVEDSLFLPDECFQLASVGSDIAQGQGDLSWFVSVLEGAVQDIKLSQQPKRVQTKKNLDDILPQSQVADNILAADLSGVDSVKDQGDGMDPIQQHQRPSLPSLPGLASAPRLASAPTSTALVPGQDQAPTQALSTSVMGVMGTMGAMGPGPSAGSSSHHQGPGATPTPRILMTQFAESMQKGDYNSGTQQTAGAIKMLANMQPRPDKDIQICVSYWLAFKILIRVHVLEQAYQQKMYQKQDVSGVLVEMAWLTIFLANTPVHPKHKAILVNKAIDKNFAVGNFGLVANWSKSLMQMTEPADQATKQAYMVKIKQCEANQNANARLLQSNKLCYASLSLVLTPQYLKCSYCPAVYGQGSGMKNAQACICCGIGQVRLTQG